MKTNFKPVGNLDKDRNELRKVVINKFLKEKPGTGCGKKASNYKYIVEELKDGRKIYLLRPAHLKGMHGFDFEIWVEKWSDDKDCRPAITT